MKKRVFIIIFTAAMLMGCYPIGEQPALSSAQTITDSYIGTEGTAPTAELLLPEKLKKPLYFQKAFPGSCPRSKFHCVAGTTKISKK